jgi:hypothetical protein
MKAKTLLELGRVSNLPTVWSNVLAGAVVAGSARPAALLAVGLAGSLFYVGGMFLNDAFDADIDARERPERPIPSGRAARGEVFVWGFGQLLLGLALLELAALSGLSASGQKLLLPGVFTACLVVAYDRFHKGNPLSPVLMGACRAGLYLMAGAAAARTPNPALIESAVALLFYVVGLTHIARFETGSVVVRLFPAFFALMPALLGIQRLELAELAPLPLLAVLASIGWTAHSLRLARRGGPNIGRAVVSLIAGISLVDAVFTAPGERLAPLVCWGCFGATLGLQRLVRGT